MKEKEIEDELVSIRSMMERSSKFISLSGLSGILAGVYALVGAAIVYFSAPDLFVNTNDTFGIFDNVSSYFVLQVSIVAVSVLLASIITALILSGRQAKRKGQLIWGPTSRSLFFHMATPLIAGSILILIFISHSYYGIIAPSSLIFYGLSLVSASNFTFTMVKYLGLCEIVLGLIAACLPGFGLLFWAIGFGVLHIIYGSLMYFKYDR